MCSARSALRALKTCSNTCQIMSPHACLVSSVWQVYLSWLLVPVGLGLLWTLYQQGRQQEASVAAGIALVALLLADGLVRAAAWSRNQAIEGAVTAANVKELLPGERRLG